MAALLAPGAGAAPKDHQVKAAFLYNLARFVEWPEKPPASFRICVVGDDPFGTALVDTVRGKTVHGRPVTVEHPQPDEVARCQIVFVASPERETVQRLLTRSEHFGVLTVGETDDVTRAGGIIGMRTEDNKVRFEVNLGAAQRAGLRVSSQLLKLATRVIR